jgi:hypothetical protein
LRLSNIYLLEILFEPRVLLIPPSALTFIFVFILLTLSRKETMTQPATKPFTFYVIQSAHTDIGYTHPQEQIKLMYVEHYNRVLALCEASKGEPETHRFKWVCETAWQVKHYLEQRPERLAEFVDCVMRGQIEITANYLHFTDLIDADALERSLAWVVTFCREHDLPLRSALHCDINGWAWSLADTLHDNGIRCFLSQIHSDSATDPLGGRGSVHYHWKLDPGASWWLSEDVPVRTPQGFWWQGPKGGRVLHYLNEHYHLGNLLGLSSFKGFGADKTRYFLEADTMKVETMVEKAKVEVPRYLERLRSDGYSLDVGLLSTGGFFVDNAPPDGRWCEVIKVLNDTGGDIHYRTATVREFFEALEERGASGWPVRAVAWPDHWAHGLGSSTRRVAQARRNQRRRADVVKLVEKSQSLLAQRYLNIALEEERFALEHTFDAWSTTFRPASPNNEYQASVKEVAFHRTELYLDEAAGLALRTLEPARQDGVRLFAPASKTDRLLHFDAGDLELDSEGLALEDETGQWIVAQADRPELRQYVALVSASESRRVLKAVPRQGVATHMKATASFLETDQWQLEVNPVSGVLTRLVDKRSGKNWVQPQNPFGFGQLVHETVIHPQGRAATSNLGRIVALGVGSEKAKALMGENKVYAHCIPAAKGDLELTRGGVFDALVWQGEADKIGAVRSEWRGYHETGLVELVVDWEKRWSDLPEAAYVTFGFDAPEATLQLETAGGLFQPGSHTAGGQLPGTCQSYYTVQRGAVITAQSHRLLWLPLDAPLVMTNELNYNRWETNADTWNGFLASMPVNHYWHTNFPTSQRGPLRLRYRLLAADTFEEGEPLEAYGWR